jgi:hypothetical protein
MGCVRGLKCRSRVAAQGAGISHGQRRQLVTGASVNDLVEVCRYAFAEARRRRQDTGNARFAPKWRSAVEVGIWGYTVRTGNVTGGTEHFYEALKALDEMPANNIG